jgi:hypothetical protein
MEVFSDGYGKLYWLGVAKDLGFMENAITRKDHKREDGDEKVMHLRMDAISARFLYLGERCYLRTGQCGSEIWR